LGKNKVIELMEKIKATDEFKNTNIQIIIENKNNGYIDVVVPVKNLKTQLQKLYEHNNMKW
jgi:hypothetical protein